MSGYTLSYRDKWENPVFRNLLEAGIWAWMCDTAAWKDTQIRFSGKLITLKRGQIAVSERFISEGFCIGRQVVRTFLYHIKTNHMVTQQVTQKITILTICNYDKYQTLDSSANPLEICNQPTPNPNKNKENESNKEKKEDISIEFEEFWKVYPKKVGKKPAFQKFKVAGQKVDHGIIMTALQNYIKCKKVMDGFVLNPTTWLEQERWNDEQQNITSDADAMQEALKRKMEKMAALECGLNEQKRVLN